VSRHSDSQVDNFKVGLGEKLEAKMPVNEPAGSPGSTDKSAEGAAAWLVRDTTARSSSALSAKILPINALFS
jgi:hypothetical protein